MVENRTSWLLFGEGCLDDVDFSVYLCGWRLFQHNWDEQGTGHEKGW
jgi:hypothetical protein